MHTVIKHQPNLMPLDKAIALAAQLNADPEDDWTYEVAPSTYVDRYAIAVIDEAKTFLGFL